MTRIAFILIAAFLSINAVAQNSLPVKTWNGHSDSAYVLFISGDGGFNKFTSSLCEEINDAGYSLTAINARSYFWDKKSPQETTDDIMTFLKEQLTTKTNFSLCLIGYSFGADVIPFVVNRLPESVKQKITSVILLSPSGTTDFEIHWSDIFGGNSKREMDVVAEINKMVVKKVAVLSGDEEEGIPANEIHLPNCTVEKIPGGHHFDGNMSAVAKAVIRYIK